jgi:hypothetical protein
MMANLNLLGDMAEYYTPIIEEFHVGFEYEQFVQRYKVLGEPKQEGYNYSYPVEHLENVWEKRLYKLDAFLTEDDGEIIYEPIDPTLVRVKYLDKEDVKSVLKGLGCEIIDDGGGWKQSYLDSLQWWVEGTISEKSGMDFFISKDKEGKISIEEDETFQFKGTIKNKSELVKILDQLGYGKNK